MSQATDIQQAVDRLAAGGVVAFPTETVYGLGADAQNAEAVARVFALKGRPAENPLIVHAADQKMAQTVSDGWPVIAAALAETFWPGPLTLVLPKRGDIPDNVTAGGPTVAVRVPDHGLTLELIGAFGRPIVGPSGNPSGYISPTTAGHVSAHWAADDVLVLDGGPCTRGIESTVLDLCGGVPTILRRGVLGAEELEPVLGRGVEYAHSEIGGAERGGAPVASPGVIGSHYQPRTPVRLIEDVSSLSRDIAEAGGPVVLLSPPGRRVRVGVPHAAIDMPGLASGYARKLYAALRQADDIEPVQIIVVMPLLQDSEIWEAVRERLRRAAS